MTADSSMPEPSRAAARRPPPDGLDARAELLRRCPLFAGVEAAELARMAAAFEPLEVEAGELVIRQEDTDSFLYVVTSGRLEVIHAEEGEDDVRLASIYPGEPLGEMAYFSDRRRSASVRAVEPSGLLRIEFSDLSDCLEECPSIAAAFLEVVTSRLRRNNRLFQENHLRLRSAQRSLRELTEFLDLTDVNALGIGIEGLIERLVHTASSLLDADRGSLFLVDPATGELWSKVAEGAEVKEIRVSRDAGVVGWVARNRRLVNIADAYEDERFNPAVDRATGYRTQTILCAPVFSLEHKTIGVVQVINKRVGAFTEDDESLFRAFAHQAAVAVENFNLYRRMAISHKKMTILLDIATSLIATLDLGALITLIVEKVTEAIGCDRCSYFVYDAAAAELWSMEASGSELKEIRFPATVGLAGFSATSGAVVNIDDAYEDPRFNRSFDERTGYRTRSVACIPVHRRDGGVSGVLQVINKVEGRFEEEDIELIKAIAAQIGVSVDNARLHARTASMRQYLQSVQESISNGIFTLDADWKLVTVNAAARRLLDLGDGDAAGQDVRTLLGSPNAHILELMRSAYRSRDAAADYDIGLATPRRGENSVNVNVMPLVDPEDGFRGLVVIVEDITSEKRVKNTLTRYMAKDIVERMLQDPTQQLLGGVRSTATVLFSDIRDFTSIAEGLSAEATMDLLNEYFGLMVEEVFAERGVLDKFMGDALMAVYGIPYAAADDAIRAVRTALNMKRTLVAFNRRRRRAGLVPIRIGIGINTDEVLSGNVGSDKRMDYTVIGDGVNVSARLESLNKQYGSEILLSETTRAQLGDAFCLRPIDRVVAKGKSRPLAIYEALGPRGHRPAPVQLAYGEGLEAYFAGRFAEALAIFRAGAREDGPSRVMAARCSALVRRPPAPPWDGVWRAREK